MYRYTTPTIPLTVDTIIPEGAQIYATFSQGDNRVTKSGSDMDVQREENETILIVTLTQEETASFKPYLPVMIQVNWVMDDGTRIATSTANISTFDNLLNEVVEYGE